MEEKRKATKEFSELSHRVIGCAIEVHRHLGPGLLESTYRQCLAHELHLNGIPFHTEYPLPVNYKGVDLDCGYRLDMLIENKIILELKSVDTFTNIHEAQLMSYLKLSKLKQGYLINFNVIRLKDGLKSIVM
jgi:GxxExxY protein